MRHSFQGQGVTVPIGEQAVVVGVHGSGHRYLAIQSGAMIVSLMMTREQAVEIANALTPPDPNQQPVPHIGARP